MKPVFADNSMYLTKYNFKRSFEHSFKYTFKESSRYTFKYNWSYKGITRTASLVDRLLLTNMVCFSARSKKSLLWSKKLFQSIRGVYSSNDILPLGRKVRFLYPREGRKLSLGSLKKTTFVRTSSSSPILSFLSFCLMSRSHRSLKHSLNRNLHHNLHKRCYFLDS